MDPREDRPFHIHDHDTVQAFDQLRLAMRIAFSLVMQKNKISPLTGLNMAAMAVGSLYVEVSAAHCGAGHCSCGWEPRGNADIEAMTSSLALSAAGGPLSIASTTHVGHA